MESSPLGTAPTFPAGELTACLAAIPHTAWGETSTLQQSGTHHGYRTASLIQPDGPQSLAHIFQPVLEAFQPVYQAWVSWLEPGGYILPHIDAGPYRERWQVPIIPGALNDWQSEAGVAFPVSHWEPHSVVNDTDRPRVHLVIDRASVLDESPILFQRVEVP
jgi:hypothetical protein